MINLFDGEYRTLISNEGLRDQLRWHIGIQYLAYEGELAALLPRICGLRPIYLGQMSIALSHLGEYNLRSRWRCVIFGHINPALLYPNVR